MPGVIRPTVARVDLKALRSNYGALRNSISHETPGHDAPGRRPPGIIAVVKANAYGHGAGQVARALEDAGADLLACADIEEGAALRAARRSCRDPGVRRPQRERPRRPVRVSSDTDDLNAGRGRAVQAAAARHNQRLRYHLKIDTGMNRLGFRFDNLARTLPDLLASPNLELDAIYTHFATADDPESALFGEQQVRFERALRQIASLRGVRGPDADGERVGGARGRPPITLTCTRRTAPRCCGIPARGTTASGPDCCSTAWCHRRWHPPSACRR